MECFKRNPRRSHKFDPIYNFKSNSTNVKRSRYRHQSTPSLPYYMRSIIKRRDAAWEDLYRTGTTEKSILYQILCNAYLDESRSHCMENKSIRETEKLDECMRHIEYEIKSTEFWYRETKKQIFREIWEGLRQAKLAIGEIREEKKAEGNVVSILYG